jgi:hypothetical protein
MSVDRGGLRYRIRIEDQFSKDLKKFRSELQKAKAEIASIQKTAGRRSPRTTPARQEAAQAEAALNQTEAKAVERDKRSALRERKAEKRRRDAARREAREARQAAERGVTETEQVEREADARRTQRTRQGQRERARAARQNAAAQGGPDVPPVRGNTPADIALRRVNNELREQEIRLEQANILRAKGNDLLNEGRTSEGLKLIQRAQEVDAQNVIKTADTAKRLNAIFKERNDQAAEAQRISNSMRKEEAAEAKRQQSVNPQFQAQKAFNKQLFDEVVTRNKINLLQGEANRLLQAGNTEEAKLRQSQADKLKSKLLPPSTDAADAKRLRELKAVFDQEQKNADSAQARSDARRKDRDKEALALKKIVDENNRLDRQDQRRADKTDPAVQAQNRLNRRLFEEQVARKQINLLRSQGLKQIGQGDLIGGVRSLQAAQGFRQELFRINKEGNNILFTFRRLIGVFAVFAAARAGFAALIGTIGTGLKFNDDILAAQIGIGGLLSALTDVRDELGQSVAPAEELSLALREARKQTEALRQDSLRTTASFEQLLETFQVSLAPGLSAGLNLDEIRKLTVDISQAATAIGLPQNQLPEEIRSLLSGTIQARTTRIATALGISNADIKRAQEAGELFTLLDEKFRGFSEAAEKQARSTLSGVTTLARGAFRAVLGEAAQPLFAELVGAGNQVLDEVLTVKDELGNLRPNPAAVAAFRTFFDGLRRGLKVLREFFEERGFEGLETTLKSFGVIFGEGIAFVRGFSDSVSASFGVVVDIVRGIANALGVTNEELGDTATLTGKVVGSWTVLKTLVLVFGGSILGIITTVGGLLKSVLSVQTGLKLWDFLTKGALGRMILLGGAVAGIVAGVNAIQSAIFDTDLTLGDTLLVTAQSLVATFLAVAEGVLLIGRTLSDISVKGSSSLASTVNRVLASSLPDGAFKDSLIRNADNIDLSQENRNRNGGGKSDAEKKLAELRAAAEKSILDTVSRRRREIKSEEDALNDIQKATEARLNSEKESEESAKRLADRAAEVRTIFSDVNQVMSELAGSFSNLDEEQRKATARFGVGANLAEGTGGQVSGIFREAYIEDNERLVKSRRALLSIEQKLADARAKINSVPLPDQAEFDSASNALADVDARRDAIRAELDGYTDVNLSLERRIALSEQVKVLDAERARLVQALEVLEKGREAPLAERGELQGVLNSLLRDEVDLRAAIEEALEKSWKLASTQAAQAAKEALPSLKQQLVLLKAQSEQERLTTQAITSRASARAQEIAQAQGAIVVAEAERQIALEKAQAEIDAVRSAIGRSTEGPERDAQQALLDGLLAQKGLEQEILDLKLQQLQTTLDQVRQVQDGGIVDGLAQGFRNFAQEFTSEFAIGIKVAEGLANGLADFISSSLVDAFDPTSDTDIVEQFARFLQSIAQLILNELAKLAIAKLILGLGFSEGGEVPSGGGLGFNRGGDVPNRRGRASLAHLRAPGLTRGGRPRRPRNISPRDTVAAWLEPGEFVIRRAVAESLPPGYLRALNAGEIQPSMHDFTATRAVRGYALGGTVQGESGTSGGAAIQQETTVLPVMVADNQGLERLTSGGDAAMLSYIRKNSTKISTILRGNSRG